MWQIRLFKAVDQLVESVRTIIPQLRGGIAKVLLIVAGVGIYLAFVAPHLLWIVPLWTGVVVAIGVIASATSVPWLRNAVGAGVVVLASAITLPNLPAYGPSGPKLPTLEQPWASQDTAQCPGTKTLHTYGPVLQVVNPGGYCKPDFWFGGHCIYVMQANSTQEKGPFCGAGNNDNLILPDDIESVRSGDGTTFTDYLRMGPPVYTTLFR